MENSLIDTIWNSDNRVGTRKCNWTLEEIKRHIKSGVITFEPSKYKSNKLDLSSMIWRAKNGIKQKDIIGHHDSTGKIILPDSTLSDYIKLVDEFNETGAPNFMKVKLNQIHFVLILLNPKEVDSRADFYTLMNS